ncbi:hypothetical protein RB595_001185 [Gaeumannomyces hyphopodioides]
MSSVSVTFLSPIHPLPFPLSFSLASIGLVGSTTPTSEEHPRLDFFFLFFIESSCDRNERSHRYSGGDVAVTGMLGGDPSLFSSVQARIAQLAGDSSAGCTRWVLVLALLAPAVSLFLARTRPARLRMAPSSAASDPKQPSDGPVPGQEDQQQQQHRTHDPAVTDPPLLQKHSALKSYTTSRFAYPAIRTVFRRHPKIDELPVSPSPIPLLVFIHGLGGSAAQFQPLLTSLINVSSCLAVDLPGCGRSEFAPADWDAYTTDSLVELLELVIEDYREKDAGQQVVLIGHSMGAALAAQLASKTSPRCSVVSDNVLGLVAICPPSQPPSEKQTSLFQRLLWIPTPIFNLWRTWDRRGGVESASVRRFVGPDADLEARKRQDRFNNQSQTRVWRRMAWGSLAVYEKGEARGGIAGKRIWQGIDVPVYLISGADDHVTPPADAEKIRGWLSADCSRPEGGQGPESRTIVDSAAPVDLPEAPLQGTASSGSNGDAVRVAAELGKLSSEGEERQDDPSTPREDTPDLPPLRSRPRQMVESVTLPSPATHALLYTPSTERVLAGLVSDFLSTSVSPRLSLGWQLQYLSREGKWDVKNLAKWREVEQVSEPIAGIFRAMKTLREVDETHCPAAFVARWGHIIKDVIDISHDTPVYDSRGLESGGVRYHKFPTVSKIPPTDDEIDAFVALVDKIRAEQQVRLQSEAAGAASKAEAVDAQRTYMIAVHCHYGKNRTGYFIVCYLVERCGFDVQAAIDEFARARPKGIRHQHFLDKLHVKYSLRRKR